MTIIPLEEAGSSHVVGAKAASLSTLRLHGFQAPAGVIIPAHYFEEFIAASGQVEAISARIKQVRLDDPVGLEAISKEITAWLVATPLPPKLRDALGSLLDQQAWERVVVRSSAIGEDGANASFAGQLDSLLDVCTSEALLEAVVTCFCSYYSARALAYQEAKGIRLQGMAVLIQPQIEGAVSGVTFTASPEDHTKVHIEYCEGGCEALVSGRVTPSVAVLSRDQTHTPPASDLLSSKQLRALAKTCLAIEDLYQAPQDIEWTIDPEGLLHILQARPITTVRPPSADEGPGAVSQVVYSNSNINENFPSPVSPLLQSVARTSYYHYFRAIAVAYGFAPRRVEAMEDSLRGIVDVHGQRLYYNVSNIHSVMRMAPFGDLFAQWFNDFVGVSNETQARKRDMTWARGRRSKITEAAELMAIVGHVTTQYATLPKQVRAFEQRVTRFAKTSTPEALVGATAEALVERVAGFLKIRNQQWIGAGLSDGACMVCCGALEWFLRRHFDDDPNVLLHGLLRGLPDIVSSEPPRHLWRLSRRIQADDALRALFEEDTPSILKALGWDGTRMNLEHPLGRPLQTFLDDWGFRCTGELMLTVSSFQEDPAPVVDMLRAYLTMESGGPDSVIKAQGKLREAQSAELEAKLDPLRALAFSKLQRATAASLALRERSRLKQALLYRCLRRIALALGARWHEAGLLLEPEDVFFLHWQELLEVDPKGPLPTKTILERKERFKRESTWRTAPDSFTLPKGEQWDPLVHAELEERTQTQEPIGDGSVLTGIAAAGGHVTARAAVALSKDDFHRIKAGDILVAPQTDPGWATVLFLVRGLVMERGGMLSHGAIIAREFGIPSVIAVHEATSRIQHASTLRVDGDKGHVHILE